MSERLSWNCRVLASAIVGLAMVPVNAVEPPQVLTWKSLSSIPDEHGFAGMFAGISDGKLLAAGGANFPDAPPWKNGTKVWYDTVWLLDASEGQWRKVGKLPKPLGYGVSATHGNSIVFTGGSDATQHSTDVIRLEWRDGSLRQSALPSLPSPMANFCGAVMGDTMYLAGGIESPNSTEALDAFLSLDLNNEKADWQMLESWPGPARMLATAAVQDGSFFLMGGTSLSAGPDGKPFRKYLTDAYRFTPDAGWKRIADLPRPAVASPTPAPTFGPSQLFLISGDDGSLYGTPPSDDHPGFPATVLEFDTRKNTWRTIGKTPGPHVTSPAVRWSDASGRAIWVVVNGESKPGVRSPEVWSLRGADGKQLSNDP